MRALLHEPLRYHPNIVKLLDIGWESSSETGSPFPTLVLEYAEFGTFDNLQLHNGSPLKFSIKQKLCYDVGRGLSILHACGIVHGDLKHENVLIFQNNEGFPPGQPYTAKLADFNGAIMDMAEDESRRLHVGTFLYSAPEVGEHLTVEGIRATDAYSYGILLWRAFIDCSDILTAINFRQTTSLSSEEERRLVDLKRSDVFLQKALTSIRDHAREQDVTYAALDMFTYAISNTMQAKATSRSLVRAQARLRGMPSNKVEEYVIAKDRENDKRLEEDKRRAPGVHGIDIDALGYFLARSEKNTSYDAQNNLPGYRPDLPEPSLGQFVFEPLKLKKMLDWSQQVSMIGDLERLADLPLNERSPEIQPWAAAYHLFQAYLSGFGTNVDPKRACQWLFRASRPELEVADVDYLAKAWLSRICSAIGTASPRTPDEEIDDLAWSIIRGHWHCIEDSKSVMLLIPDSQQLELAQKRIEDSIGYFRTITGGTGMPYFVPRNIRRPYDLSDIYQLDAQIQLELGSEYADCLRAPNDDMRAPPPPGGHRFDEIFVNRKGHGLLHYAASFGELGALRHMYTKYKCNIDLPNQALSESPLVCACRSGQLDCALFLLDQGANPNGQETGQEAPLHWLSSFQEHEMRIIVSRFIASGVNLSRFSRRMRKEIRYIISDWEDRLNLPLTPLGRAVLMQNLPAVRVLLEMTDSDPHDKADYNNSVNLSPIQLAAILTLPDFLDVLLNHARRRGGYDIKATWFDEWDFINTARNMLRQGHADPLALQSRLVRCGVNYKQSLVRTIRILHDWRTSQSSDPDDYYNPELKGAACFTREVDRGDLEIVEALANLGQDVNGFWLHKPIRETVEANNIEMLELLLGFGANAVLGNDDETLLQTFASRPKTGPESLRIAEFLIEMGVSIEEAGDDKPSPLAFAIKNGYFELADLLIFNGAGDTINHFYKWESVNSQLTVLGYLLMSHTYNSLMAIDYIANKHKEGLLNVHPLVNATESLTAVHMLALQEPGKMNSRQQVSARITQRLLEMFPSMDSLGEDSSNAKYGTPLTAAIFTGNESTVMALIQSEYRDSIHMVASMDVFQINTSEIGPVSPLVIALGVFARQLQTCQRQGSLSKEEFQRMNRHHRVGVFLSDMIPTVPATGISRPDSDETVLGVKGILAQLEESMKMLKRLVEAQSGVAGLNMDVTEGSSVISLGPSDPDLPVDLSQLTKEKQNNWWDPK